jgi:hypothetical protein
MAGKKIISKILRATQIIVRASSDDSHFLPFTHNPKQDSGGRARQDNYFFRRSIACLSNEETQDSGTVFALQF